MTLLQARVDTWVIALWLGHFSGGVRSTDAHLHTDISIKEKAATDRLGSVGIVPILLILRSISVVEEHLSCRIHVFDGGYEVVRRVPRCRASCSRSSGSRSGAG